MIAYGGGIFRPTANISSAAIDVRRQWISIFKVLRENCKSASINFYNQINHHLEARVENSPDCVDRMPYPDSCTERDGSTAKKDLVQSDASELQVHGRSSLSKQGLPYGLTSPSKTPALCSM